MLSKIARLSNCTSEWVKTTP